MRGSNWCLYIHTNKINGKKYVGITSQKPEKRWQNGSGYDCGYFKNAISKYGWDEFEHEILYKGLDNEKAHELEREYIKLFNTTNKENGYNLTDGGQGTNGYKHKHSSIVKMSIAKRNMSEETRKKMSIANKGKATWMKGKHHTKETRARLSYLAKNMPEEQKQKIRDSLIGQELSESTKRKMQINNIKNEKVMCGGSIFISVAECARHYNVNRGVLRDYLLGKYEMSQKFKDLGLTYCDDSKNKDRYKFEEEKEVRRARLREISAKNASKKVTCDGIIYKSVKSCAEHYNIKPPCMSMWLTGKRNMPEMFKNLGLEYCA